MVRIVMRRGVVVIHNRSRMRIVCRRMSGMSGMGGMNGMKHIPAGNVAEFLDR